MLQLHNVNPLFIAKPQVQVKMIMCVWQCVVCIWMDKFVNYMN